MEVAVANEELQRKSSIHLSAIQIYQSHNHATLVANPMLHHGLQSICIFSRQPYF